MGRQPTRLQLAVGVPGFKPDDLGIDRLDRPVVVRPHGPVAGHTPCEVLFWSEWGVGDALVTRPAHGAS